MAVRGCQGGAPRIAYCGIGVRSGDDAVWSKSDGNPSTHCHTQGGANRRAHNHTHSHGGPDCNNSTNSYIRPHSNPNTNSHAGADRRPNADALRHSCAYAESNARIDCNTHTHPRTYPDSCAHTHTDSHRDTDAHTDSGAFRPEELGVCAGEVDSGFLHLRRVRCLSWPFLDGSAHRDADIHDHYGRPRLPGILGSLGGIKHARRIERFAGRAAG